MISVGVFRFGKVPINGCVVHRLLLLMFTCSHFKPSRLSNVNNQSENKYATFLEILLTFALLSQTKYWERKETSHTDTVHSIMVLVLLSV